ncbi:extracellular solute-binding protein [Enterovibrio sp. Hal110]
MKNSAIHYVYPEEGTVFWMDNMVIPKHAENKDATYAFINVLMKPENQAVLVEDIGYAVPNLGALKHLPDALRNIKVIFPPTEVSQKANSCRTSVKPCLFTINTGWS